jgi:hypothetical protein
MENRPLPNELLPGETHTEFAARIYSAYTQEKKDPVILMLRTELSPILDDIRFKISGNPEGWYVPYHFGWGMAVRNLLREKGYGEEYWPIWNIDDIYVQLVEDACR